jgi:hypothetical protein
MFSRVGGALKHPLKKTWTRTRNGKIQTMMSYTELVGCRVGARQLSNGKTSVEPEDLYLFSGNINRT